jgi:hypothetical protein
MTGMVFASFLQRKVRRGTERGAGRWRGRRRGYGGE